MNSGRNGRKDRKCCGVCIEEEAGEKMTSPLGTPAE
jgi:hypothetical protein